jgi:Ni/Co efflux regulator RcnB
LARQPFRWPKFPNRKNIIMKALLAAVSVAALIAGAAGSANAQHDNHGGSQQHAGWGQDHGSDGHQWGRGDRMGYNDWNNAPRVDYRQHHLRRPPNGYEWRESNGQYVMAAVATGLVASMILDSNR